MKCTKCGKEIDNNSKFCEGCGATIESATANSDGKKKRVKFKDLPKKQKITRIIIGCACFLVAGILMIVDGFGGASRTAEKESIYIDCVKEGSFEDFPDVTIETAFNEFFSDPEWESFTSEEGLNVVEFNGGCTVDEEETNCCIQFNVFEDGTFETYYVDLGGEQLTLNEDIVDMYEVIFGMEASGGDEEAFNNALLMLYEESALPAEFRQAIAAGIYDDISIGDMIDYMFPDPEINFEREDEDTIIVEISGNYRHSIYDSITPNSGTISYSVSDNGMVMTKNNSDGIKGIMETLAVELARN